MVVEMVFGHRETIYNNYRYNRLEHRNRVRQLRQNVFRIIKKGASLPGGATLNSVFPKGRLGVE